MNIIHNKKKACLTLHRPVSLSGSESLPVTAAGLVMLAGRYGS